MWSFISDYVALWNSKAKSSPSSYASNVAYKISAEIRTIHSPVAVQSMAHAWQTVKGEIVESGRGSSE
jgi:hypothetical protein